MGKFDQITAHHKHMISTMQSEIASMEKGEWVLWENKGAGRVDITAKWIEEQKRRIAELERVVAAYEAFDA